MYIRPSFYCPTPGFLFFVQQPAKLPDCLLGGSPSLVLGTLHFGFLPLTALSGIPHLAAQLFRSIQKSAPKKFLRCGLNLFFCFLGNGSLFFHFWDMASPLCFLYHSMVHC